MQLSVLSRRLLRSACYRSYPSVLSNRAQVSSVRCFSTSPKLSEPASSVSPRGLVALVVLASIVGAGAMYLDSKECSTSPRDKYIHEIIEELRSHDLSPLQVHQCCDKDYKPVLFDLNPDVADLIKKHPLLLIEGGPGEGKRTQVMRSILESRPNHGKFERPLILFACFRYVTFLDNPYSYFFERMPWFHPVKKEANPEELLKDVVTAAIARGIPVYIVLDNVERLADYVYAEEHKMFKSLSQLSLDNQENKKLKIVHIASRYFSRDLKKYSGHFESYRWTYDLNSISSGLKKCNKTLGQHADDLTKVFGNRIESYTSFHAIMGRKGDYDRAISEVKRSELTNIRFALRDLRERQAGGIMLLNELAKEGEVLYTNDLDNKVIEGLQKRNIIHFDGSTVTWVSPLTKIVYDDIIRYNTTS